MIFSHQAARSKGEAAAQDGQAARAAATASPASAALPDATVANVSPDDGLTAAAGSPRPARQLPPMYSRCSRTVLASRLVSLASMSGPVSCQVRLDARSGQGRPSGRRTVGV